MLIDFPTVAVNDERYRAAPRGRTVPIPESIHPVAGYPRKLVVFKIAASRYWQVRCWVKGKTYRLSTHSLSLRVAQSFARSFYEQVVGQASISALAPSKPIVQQQLDGSSRFKASHTFGALAAQMLANETARVERGEFALGSLQVLRNRLDSHLLPRWGNRPASSIDYAQLLAFVDFMSKSKSSITIGQYLVAIRKVLSHGMRIGAIAKLPEFPKVKVKTASRGAFTPSEYWSIIQTARRLRGQPHPDTTADLRKSYRLVQKNYRMPPDLAWAIGFMVNSFIRPSDLKTLKHRHVEVVHANHHYLRLTLPETKRHDKPVVTLFPAVRIYRQIVQHQQPRGRASPGDYLFLPELRDRNYALSVLSLMFNWVLGVTGHKSNPNGQPRSLYSLRHSAITFRLLYGQGIDLLTLARNARTSVEVISKHYASTVTGEQNIALLQSRRTRASVTS